MTREKFHLGFFYSCIWKSKYQLGIDEILVADHINIYLKELIIDPWEDCKINQFCSLFDFEGNYASAEH